MDFSGALNYLKNGYRVKRAHWGGYWFIPDGLLNGWESIERNQPIKMNQMIVAKLKDNGGFAPATTYQEDLLATDWQVITEISQDGQYIYID